MSHNYAVVPVESILIGARQRTLDEDTKRHISSLLEEIKADGLIHAPTIDKGNNLVAGFCRLSAIRALDKPYFYAGAQVAPGFIPVVYTHWERKGDLFRIELHENLRRKNLTAIDEAKAISELHRFQQELHGSSWTQEDTGKELDKVRGEGPRTFKARNEEVADSLLIEQFANDPEVQKAKSRNEAKKIATKKLEQAFTQGLGALQALKQSDFKLIHGDLASVIKTFEKESFHGIVVDPPYGVDADKFGDQTTIGGHAYVDTQDLAIEVAGDIFMEGYRVCKPDAHLYLFCDIRLFDTLRNIADTCNWQVFPTPLIWYKPGLGHAPIPGYFGRRYETILFAQKKGGSRRLQRSRSDVFEYPPVKDKIHAAQKPQALIKELLELSFFPGEHILDPCCGSGTIFHAARSAKMRATGIEKSLESFNIAMLAANPPLE